jgi:predicted enzyme related to lactoylglutathione lyase
MSAKHLSPELSHIGIVMRHVDNVDLIRAFYTETMGMRQLWQDPKTGSSGLQAGTQMGPTFIVDSKQSSPDGRVEFNFETADVCRAYERMTSNGVNAGEIRHFDDGSALFHFQDPDGYTLMVWGCNR